MKNEIMIREPELYFDSIHQELNNFLRDTFLTNAFANPLNIKNHQYGVLQLKLNKMTIITKSKFNCRA